MRSPLVGLPATGPEAPKWRLARVLRVTLVPLLRALFRIRTIGIENIPADGGCIFAGNHVSYLDPILLWCVLPRPTHFIAREDLFDLPLVGWVSTRVWAFPIARGSADRQAIQRATDLLKAGESVGMFPEGTRKAIGDSADPAELGAAHSGVSFIAMRADAPVIPVGISGTERALPRGARFLRFVPVTISFGRPISPDTFSAGGRKERTAAMTDEIMRSIAQQRDAAGEE